MKLGLIGLGKMGSRMAEKLVLEGHEVVVWNRTPEKAAQLASRLGGNQRLLIAKDIADLVGQLPTPRVIILMLPAGQTTTEHLDQVKGLAAKNDIVVDSANSYYKDTESRAKTFAAAGIRFLGMGVSGGVIAVKQGYPQMVGGDKSAYEHIKPILDSLATPHGGHEYFGPGGAGHFVKMVHNGIEYPVMQALGEGFGILDTSPYKLDLLKVAKLYQKGTLVAGFMLDRAVEALTDGTVSEVEGEIGSASGEAVWTVEQAKTQGVPAEAIEQAIAFRKRSATENKVKQSFAARMIGALRITFGGHPVKRKTSK